MVLSSDVFAGVGNDRLQKSGGKEKFTLKICATTRFRLIFVLKLNRNRRNDGPVHSNLLRYDMPNKQGRAGL